MLVPKLECLQPSEVVLPVFLETGGAVRRISPLIDRESFSKLLVQWQSNGTGILKINSSTCKQRYKMVAKIR